MGSIWPALRPGARAAPKTTPRPAGGVLAVVVGRPDWLDAGRIPSLDGLRAVAVALVLLAHAHQTRGFPDLAWLHAVGASGPVGADVFFVLSGFLVTTLLLREEGRSGRLDLRAFYRRRALRIVPAYACLLLCVLILDLLGAADVRRRDWLAALTYTTNFLYRPAWDLGHAWSLSIEEHFYLLWPPAVAALSARSRPFALAACLGFCPGVRWAVLLFAPAWSPMAELWTFSRIDTIAAGCLLAVLARDPAWRPRLDRWAGWWGVALAVLVASLAASRLSAKWSVGVAGSVNAACLALLVWAAASRPPRWLNLRSLSAVGVGSYSLYLWQQLFLKPGGTDWANAFPQNLALASLAAWASYALVESPFLRWKDGPARRTTTRGPGPAAGAADPGR